MWPTEPKELPTPDVQIYGVVLFVTQTSPSMMKLMKLPFPEEKLEIRQIQRLGTKSKNAKITLIMYISAFLTPVRRIFENLQLVRGIEKI
jgi:hypothetical protein